MDNGGEFTGLRISGRDGMFRGAGEHQKPWEMLRRLGRLPGELFREPR
jgi:hypothetical protein